MISYVLVGVLAVFGLYALIRLLEWDKVNEETPNQEDPLYDEDEES